MQSPSKFAIDAGHGLGNGRPGRFDPGAVAGGVRESDLTLAYALAFRHLGGDTVMLTRADDKLNRSIRDRIRLSRGCRALISLHFNAGPVQASGTETFYRDAVDRRLAARVQRAVVRALGLPDRGVKPETVSAHGRLGLFDFDGPACLVELGFLTNPDDRALLLRRSSRIAVAQAVLSELKLWSSE